MKNLYKLTTLLIAVTLSTGLMAQTSTPPSNYETSDGSSGDPYFISSLDNLYWLSQTSSDWDKYFKQTTNIDASTTSGWDGNAGFSPIGNSTTKFTGSYNGQNYTISNLFIYRPSTNFIGLFGWTQGTIINLGITSATITGDLATGTIVGYLRESTSNISNCYSTGSVTGGQLTGGLVGYLYQYASVENCYTTCTVVGSDMVGGFVGRIRANCSIDNSYSVGNATGGNVDWIYIGGFTGLNEGLISNCCSHGNAIRSGGSDDRVGGFCGTHKAGIIQKCYSTGRVIYNNATNPTNKGFCGALELPCSYPDNFFDKTVSLQDTDANGTATPKTTAEMKNVATFTLETTVGLTNAWDFIGNPNDDAGTNDYWSIDGTTNSGYPFLSWEAQCWDGGNSKTTDWHTTSNWQSGSVPTPTDDVSISNTTTMPVISGSTTAECNDLVVAYGSTLTIEDDGKLTASGDLTNSGTITVESTSSGTGSLIVEGTATGSVVQERYIAAAEWGTWDDGWHFLSSPVANYAIATNFTATDYDFYAWSEKYNVWVNYKDGSNPAFSDEDVNGSNNFELGRGYLAAYKLESTRNFTGTINVADVEIIGLTITGEGNHRSWHLLGNPFNSALTWYTDWTKSNITGTAQIWNEDNRSYSAITADGIIPATNGFMVQASEETGTLTIPETERVHSATAFYKSTEYPIIKLKANNIDYPSAQESQLRFNPESTFGWDLEFDGDFLSGFAPYFYSIVEGVPQSVNSMPDLKGTTSIPFTFIKNDGLNFSIEMYEVENMLMDVWLLDKKLNNNHNLSQNPLYLFTAFEQDDHERFVIQFAPVGIEEEISSQSNIQTWAANKTVHILNPENSKGEIRILNLFGQQVAQARLTGDTKQSIQLNIPTGCYLVSIVSGEEVVTRKVIMK